MILSFLFFAFVTYLVYKLVVDFVWPIYKTTRQVKKKFREMNEQMQARNGNGTQYNSQYKPEKSTQKKHQDDYIDFEEVKG